MISKILSENFSGRIKSLVRVFVVIGYTELLEDFFGRYNVKQFLGWRHRNWRTGA
jgi:hypothetical protein